MVAFLFTILISYIIVSLFAYSAHWALHQPWIGKANQSHMAHHLLLYPSTDFSSDIYRHAGKDSTPKFFFKVSLPLIITPILLGIFNVLPWYLVITVLVVEGLIGFLHDYLHDSFHIKNHFLTRIPGIKILFNKWVELHKVHHLDMEANYGIFVFHWDRIFRSFKN